MNLPRQSQEQVARLRFPSERGRIAFAVDRIMRAVRESGLVVGQEIEVELSLREALDNAVVHGNRMDARKWVHVRCHCDAGEGVTIVVRDEGPGFDPRPFAAAAGTGEGRPGRGEGLLIMRSYMDEVSFGHGGSEVRLRKEPALFRAPSRGPGPRPVPCSA